MRNRERRAAARSFLPWLLPLAVFLAAETVTGNLFRITPVGWILSLAVYYLLYAGALVLCRSSRGCWPVLSLLIYALALGEYFVISFRQRPAMIWDVLALRTAMTVSANYTYTVTPRMVLTFVWMAACCIAAWKWPVRLSKTGGKRLAAQIGGWLGGAFAFFALLFGVLVPRVCPDVPMWDPIVSFEEQGFLLSTVISLKNIVSVKPDGYSEEAVKAILEAAEEEARGEQAALQNAAPEENVSVESAAPGESADGERITPVNIICVMNESFSDLSLYNELRDDTSFETDADPLTFFRSLRRNAQTGDLYVPVFGAMTANSEYEFLTGNSCAFAPQGSIPYQFYTRPGDDSLARVLGAQGYRTVAMHPYPGYNWNRTQAYENLGFDEFLDQDYYDKVESELLTETGGPGLLSDWAGFSWEKPRGYLSDLSDYAAILRLLSSKEPGEKLFVFNVTLQNHGGYEVDGLESRVHVTKINGRDCAGEFLKADQYLTLVQMSDQALERFLSALADFSEPTMVVLFGDHQPSVETSFFEALYGARWSEVPDQEKLHSFVTPYLIWTNYDREAREIGDTSAFMLGSAVLGEAGIEKPAFWKTLENLGEKFPAVHSMGVLDTGGRFLSVKELGSLDVIPRLREFHILQYDRMFGGREDAGQ